MTPLATFSPAPSAGPHTRDRRTFTRYPVKPDACWNINLVVGEHLHFATVRNISVRGIGLILDRELEPGTTFSAELTSLSGLSACAQELRVAHVSEQSAGRYAVGCKFDHPLTHDQLEALLR